MSALDKKMSVVFRRENGGKNAYAKLTLEMEVVAEFDETGKLPPEPERPGIEAHLRGVAHDAIFGDARNIVEKALSELAKCKTFMLLPAGKSVRRMLEDAVAATKPGGRG